ncbi:MULTISPECIES: SDR family NAD(P)-dependent oxidoreductase [Mycobacteriaceae]|uniref:Retinol dehydrogenase n=1 Tax=Mycolicibacterium neoaurum VKM Ac-1815D TaxID=700508 RepID=V5X7G2_MYCNE|nr:MULTISPECIES: SDR family NAD(P)-dependent oxidoreductase [Mycobacteriaceae]AHC23359.1 retinol dehydrogenase [Mycolicibacterium neoaurum VKM Ac-1815D]AMO04084.1 retinol dehydrogenase [Mycolicibacterium neoaurum]AXK77648.1 SDR family NAD(P)-dependent oxidoreductase [Mycolicibacterium neoaurum]KJQ49873.1 retinol dehydrogenase [Mycolicibacterium neoaurum]KUM07662.1 retinol dehydrogenase [Mycolicibacterium neoaurum]
MPTVLVTGAGRGIGRVIAEQLAVAGWDVIAGVRNTVDGAMLTATHPQRISSVILDITDAEHIAALDAALPARLDAVVNNAGIVVAGPVETVTADQWRKQLEVNVIGQLAVTQAVLPRLRGSQGRVLFISSVNGRLSTPMVGAYAASKFALEAAADALRMELRPWSIPVVLIEPAQTDTDMWRRAPVMVDDAEAALSPEHRALYARHISGMRKSIPVSQRMAVNPKRVAGVVIKALTEKRPRARYAVGAGPKLQLALLTRLPATVRDRLLRSVMRQP